MNSFLDNIEGKGAIMKQKILGLCITTEISASQNSVKN